MTQNTYPTKDLMIAACILAKGIPLIDYTTNGEYLTFIFDNKELCDQIEKDWWAGTGIVVASKYAEAIKRLKNLVYSKFSY